MPNVLPVILLKELIILPNQEIKIELNNRLSQLIIKKACNDYESKVLVVTPLDSKEEEPSIDDLPNIGVIAKIKNKIILPNNNLRITLRGLKRVVINKYYGAKWNENVLNCDYTDLELPRFVKTEAKALERKLIATLKEYIDSSLNISNSILTTVSKAKNLSNITDIIASFMPFNFEKKCEYMQNINPLHRARNLINDLEEEMIIMRLDEEIDEKLNASLEANQKEFILKEKIKVIKKELGEKTTQEIDAERYDQDLNKLKLSKDITNKLKGEIAKYRLLNESSPELGVLRNYLEWTIYLPWHNVSREEKDYHKVLAYLNGTHYGLEKIKNRISEYVAIKASNNELKSPIICLVGPPGVGKTSIAMAISTALKRKFYKISVGGLNDSTELIGSRRTYLGANPGKIIQGLKKCGTKNPVILIDEVDKMTKDFRGDPASTLLEIIDPVQNKYFTDNYIEEPFDLSDVLFILTANNRQDIPATILDRVEIIELNSYTIFEKCDIATNYLLPRILEEYKVTDLKFSPNLLYFIIKNYTQEAGVRELERILASLVRKKIINQNKVINEKLVIKYLGNPPLKENLISEENYGEANILGVNNFGGFASKVEVALTDGDDKIFVTGSVGSIIEESALVALNYLKSVYKINCDKKNIHIHFLDAASKKNGPSAGLSIALAILSLIKGKKIAKNMAFTGEISLTGEILKIGGLKEKLIAAYNNDINIVYIPQDNINDLEEIPTIIKNKIEIIPIRNFKEIYTKIFK